MKNTLTVRENATQRVGELSTSEGDGRTVVQARVAFTDGTYVVLDLTQVATQFTPVR